MATCMNVLFPEFFGQALGECANTEFSDRKRARSGVASDRRRGPCEDEGSPLPCTALATFTWLFKIVLGELEHDFSRESVGGENVDIQ